VILGILSLLPYKVRIALGSKLFSTIISPLLGNPKRINDNLSFVMPDLHNGKKKVLVRAISRNIGRTIFELFSPDDFSNFAIKAKVIGPGFQEIQAANKSKKPIILVSGHYGNYDVVRANLKSRGIEVGALYKPMQNIHFNKLYLEKISKIGRPLFPRGRQGMNQMIQYLKKGNCIAILFDQVMGKGEPLKFFGKTAYTATSVAKLAIKYDAVLIPFFSERQSDGINFELFFDNSIPHGEPTAMTQQLNNLLEKRIRNNMNQWLWTHKRWKQPPNLS
jgi:KDO2-lipid IV(A) lauroyltransferase